ncbi:MAG: AmmeMemoRadiSam system protein B, partial [Candidatus Omnitrophota bacterium]
MRKWIAVGFGVCFLFVGAAVVQAKQADLAGAWYSDSPGVLRAEIQGYLDGASVGRVEGDIIGAVAPHAGLRFSGPIAASAYKAIKVKGPALAVVVGFTHRRYFPGRIA